MNGSWGVSPEAVLRRHARKEIEPKSLRCFTAVSQIGEGATGKLKKHANYARHGFWQPTFYILESDSILEKILTGERDEAPESDLTLLTSMPLVIRTSCTDNTGPLLPRSNQLMTAQQARDWLYTDFPPPKQSKKGSSGRAVYRYLRTTIYLARTGRHFLQAVPIASTCTCSLCGESPGGSLLLSV